MSRGGRGGFGRGGRGGGFGGAPNRDLPFEIDPSLKPDFTPSLLFPPHPPPVQSTLSRSERLTITRFLDFLTHTHTGPFYTVLGKRKPNAFSDISRFSAQFERKRRKVPKLDARPYVVEFFPGELWGVMGVAATVAGGEADTNGKTPVRPLKRLHFSALSRRKGGGEGSDDDENEYNSDPEADLDGIVKGEDDTTNDPNADPKDGDDNDNDEDDEEEEEEEEDEDQFADDMEGDYNAEQYFESGEGEGWGDEEGGGDEGWF